MGNRISAVLVLGLTMCLTSFAQTSDEARKFDEFGNICCADMKARLDDFAANLLKRPTAQGYIIFYEGRRYASCNDPRLRTPLLGEGKARAEHMVTYLLDTHRDFSGIPIVLVAGGYREGWGAELWIVPNVNKAPKPTPTLEKKDVQFRKGKISRREYECLGYIR